MYTYLYIYIYTYMCVYMYICIYVDMYICEYVYMCMCICICMCIFMYTYKWPKLWMYCSSCSFLFINQSLKGPLPCVKEWLRIAWWWILPDWVPTYCLSHTQGRMSCNCDILVVQTPATLRLPSWTKPPHCPSRSSFWTLHARTAMQCVPWQIYFK